MEENAQPCQLGVGQTFKWGMLKNSFFRRKKPMFIPYCTVHARFYWTIMFPTPPPDPGYF